MSIEHILSSKPLSDEEITKQIFEERLASTSDEDFFTLDGPLTQEEVHEKINEMIRILEKEKDNK